MQLATECLIGDVSHLGLLIIDVQAAKLIPNVNATLSLQCWDRKNMMPRFL
ncbi:MAG: hypothetical protein VX098_05005 [Pseudomonadota bacterium]|nr:hypothetical protein [Pseudomonadota bacterium]